MRPTVRLGRIFGIDVGVHWSVLVIAGLWVYLLTGGGGPVELWIAVVGAVVAFFASLLAHELSHAVVAKRNGMTVRGITLWLLGGVAQLGSPMPSAGVQFRVAAAGPATSVLLSGGFLALAELGHGLGMSALVISVFAWLALMNIVLAAFNLIPAAPLDGGRLLASLLWVATGDRTRADVGATRAGQVVGGAFMAVGVVGTLMEWPFGSFWTFIVGWFIFNSATAEQRYARATGALGSRRVRDVQEPLSTVRGWQTIASFLDELDSAGAQRSLHAVEAWTGGVVGVVSLERVLGVPREDRGATRVQDVMVPLSLVPTAEPDEYLVHVVDRMGRGILPCLLVMREGEPAGLVAPADLATRTGSRAPVPAVAQV
jgi:Zn-dependent protease